MGLKLRPTPHSSHLLAFPNRLARFLLRLFSSNSDVLELAVIHLPQLSPLPVALNPQSTGCSAPTEDRNFSCSRN